MMDGKTNDGPSDDPILRAMQKLALDLDVLCYRSGGRKDPERCLHIREEHDSLMKELQDKIKLPDRRVYNFKEE